MVMISMRNVVPSLLPGGRHPGRPHYSETAPNTWERFEMTAEVPASAAGRMRGSDVERKRDGARSTLVWDVLQEVITARAAQSGRAALDIVDVRGGTGGFAVPFAALGHRVTVVDPS